MGDFEIEGLKELLEKFDDLSKLDVETAALAGMYKFQSLAQQREDFPVETGAMRQNVTTEKIDGGASTTFNQEYAFYQEYGSSKMVAKHPYARPTLDEHGEEILKVIGDNLDAQIASKGGA
jgi:HK97 gp10 family phage protein